MTGMRTQKLFMIFLLAAALTACSSQKPAGGVTVRVACFPNITHSQALVGMADGRLQKAIGEQNKIEWKVFNAGPSEIEALFAGEVDIGYIGPGPAINGYAKSNGEIRIIAGAANAGAILVSRKDLKIKSVKELDGKKVAVPQFGNTQDLILRHLLKQSGLTDVSKGGTVHIIQAENPDIETLLDKNDIDAALVPEPWGSRLEKELEANVVLDYDKVWRDGKYATTVVIARVEFIEKHPDIVRRFLQAHVEFTDYISRNSDQAKKIINAQINSLTKKPLSKEILDAAFQRLTVTNDPEKEAGADFVKFSTEAGILKKEPDMKNLFDLKLLNAVLKQKGEKEIN